MHVKYWINLIMRVSREQQPLLLGRQKQDLEAFGLDNPQNTINLAKKAAEKGGKLSMEDLVKLHGIS